MFNLRALTDEFIHAFDTLCYNRHTERGLEPWEETVTEHALCANNCLGYRVLVPVWQKNFSAKMHKYKTPK